ncbi:hypothetical protein [Roseibium sp.]|uniref:hypothetical protein n=1 Tax=Roseibium sp. TaxID=1936156 RepID=UPI003BA9B2ED
MYYGKRALTLATLIVFSTVNTVAAAQTFCSQTKSGFPEQWTDAIVSTISFFENSKEEPYYAAVTKDFDGQGISAGLLQWNIGKESLQPLVRDIINTDEAKFDEIFGEYSTEFKEAFRPKSTTLQLNWAKSLHTYKNPNSNNASVRGAKWNDKGKQIKSRLVELLQTPASKQQQDIRIAQLLGRAWNYSNWWIDQNPNRTADSEPLRIQEVAFFADTLVFNGCWWKTANYSIVSDFINAHGDDEAKSKVIGYLTTDLSYRQLQNNEAEKNYELWKNKNLERWQLELLVFAYHISKNINKGHARQFKKNVLSRRGTILLNDGWVNGKRYKNASFPTK